MRTALTRYGLFGTIILAGITAGSLDIADAFLFFGLRGVQPVRILQGIAFGLIGHASYSLGIRSALLGLLLHYFIAITVAAIYMLACQQLPHLSKHPLVFGALYGVGVYIVMNYVVLPLSHIGVRPMPPLAQLINGIAALVFCVGIPIAFMARRYFQQRA